jgi:hypothetical protein
LFVSMSSATLLVEEEEEDRTTTQLRLRLHALNLPRQNTNRVRKRPPNVKAIVTSATSLQSCSEQQQQPAVFQFETETIPRSCHPQWTATYTFDYDYGSQLLFYVHIFHSRACDSDSEEEDDEDISKEKATNRAEGAVSRKGSVTIGKALFGPTASNIQLTNSNQKATGKSDTSLRGGNSNMVSLGTALFEVGDVLGSAYGTKVKRMHQGGCIGCRLERANKNGGSQFTFQLGMATELVLPHEKRRQWTNLLQTEPDTVLELAKRPVNSARKDGNNDGEPRLLSWSRPWVTVWRSQPVLNSIQPTWDGAKIDLSTLCNELTDPIRISVRAVRPTGGRYEIGMAETTIGHLLDTYVAPTDAEEKVVYLQRSENKAKQVGSVRILLASIPDGTASSALNGQYTSVQRSHSFNSSISSSGVMDVVDLAALRPMSAPVAKSFQTYAESGVEIDFGVAIDFTSSNGDPREPSSYHYQGEGTMNDYEETISAIGKALAVYSTTQQYPVWGFGAKYGGVCRNLFQCGPDAVVHGVDGILRAYKSVFQTDLVMSGPTEFLQVLQVGAARAKKYHDSMTNQLLRYMVLLIITDGVMDSFEETQRKLQVYSHLPLSFVFVGVGRASFNRMYHLCKPLSSNTTFVEFRHHQHNPMALGEAALKNVPLQLCNYMQARGF